MRLKIIISAGEIVDKATILEIKAGRITDGNKIASVLKELKELTPPLNRILSSNKNIKKLKEELFKVNSKLWNIENSIRMMEARKDFGTRFIKLARSIYINNDKRSKLKNRINLLSGSVVEEVKEYSNY